jgi:uncharacterized membrane protein YfcA
VQQWEAAAVVMAAVGAGVINTVAGSGTLITFPTLLALGYPPVTANISNSLGLAPGGLAGAWGYRRELAGQRPTLARLVPWSVAGGVLGAVLLLRLPDAAFDTVVPVLIGASVLLVLLQPWLSTRLSTRLAARPAARPAGMPDRVPGSGWPVRIACLGAGVYGGYFGAAQGVLLIGLLGWLLAEPLQRVNAVKNVLASLVNAIAGVGFVVLAGDRVDWAVVVLVAAGSTAGGLLGARVGRRLPAALLRAVIAVVGVVAVVRLVST